MPHASTARRTTGPGHLLSVTALPGDRPDQVVVTVIGEVDAFTAPLLRACLRTQSVQDGVRELVVDLERVTFFAAAGVAVVAQARSRCRRRGVRLVVRSGGRRDVLLPLELTGLADILTLDPTDTGRQGPWGALGRARPQPLPRARRSPRVYR